MACPEELVASVRRRIRDTDPTRYVFSDEEIRGFLEDANCNPDEAAALALRALAADRARLAKVRQVHLVRLDLGDMVEHLLRLADEFHRIAVRSKPTIVIKALQPGDEGDLREEIRRLRRWDAWLDAVND